MIIGDRIFAMIIESESLWNYHIINRTVHIECATSEYKITAHTSKINDNLSSEFSTETNGIPDFNSLVNLSTPCRLDGDITFGARQT